MPKYKAKIYRHTEYEITFESPDLGTAKKDAELLIKDEDFDREDYLNEDIFIKDVSEDQ